MKIATPLKKVNLSFPATPLKAEILSSPLFLKTWLEVQTPPPFPAAERWGGGVEGSAHYLSTMFYCEITPLNRDVTWSKL